MLYDKRSCDLQYDMVGDSSVTKETVPVVGDWEDYTGSAIVSSKQQQQFAGLSNELFGTDPGVQGIKIGALGEVGQNIQTTRRRVIRKRVFVKKND